MSKQVEVFEGQTLIDIAIQEYGCYEGVMLLLKDNEVSITQELTTGQIINVQNVVPELTEKNQAIATYFKANKAKVNSGFTTSIGESGALGLIFNNSNNTQYLPII